MTGSFVHTWSMMLIHCGGVAQALKIELQQLEADAAALEAAALSSCSNEDGSATGFLKCCATALQQLDGRFQFLWGIYRAHSKAEDEIVFPALESKEALHNVSHAYTLDHAQEEQLLLDVASVIARVRNSNSMPEVRELSLQLRRMCAAVRASLETHVRAEEAELWPLFAEHFTVEEQQHLVGVIIGRTGAEVLQAMLPWVIGSVSDDERQAMMEYLREATKNTMFDQWLDAIQGPGGVIGFNAAAGVPGGQGGNKATGAHSPQHKVASPEDTLHEHLAEIAEYLSGGGNDTGLGASDGSNSTKVAVATQPAVDAAIPDQQHPTADAAVASTETAQHKTEQHDLGINDTALPWNDSGAGLGSELDQHLHLAAEPCEAASLQEVSGTVAESSAYRPGWEDIFNINQKQLEAAIRRVSNDPNLEPQRKAYLIQNIMVSRYIVAQQRRMQQLQQSTPARSSQALSAAPADPTQLHIAGSGACLHAPMPPPAAAGPSSSAAPAADAKSTSQSAVALSPFATYHDASNGILGCKHYRRKAQLVAPCCRQAFTCRVCHDDATNHRMDRYAVNEMVCMACGLQQPVAGTCVGCSTTLAKYYCSICHLFDDEPGRDIYHCPFCNVCRRGKGLGVDFFHCMQCNSCMSLSLFNSHTCRERAMEGNCPVCHEYLFDSSTPIKELPCGHFLHSSCFAAYTRYNYTCPICCKSIGDMSVYFQMLDSLLSAERARLPPEYAGRQTPILCHDCGRMGQAPYHFVYHACPSCHSYNTRVM